MLIRFDCDVEYGPSSGITWIDRYYRAVWYGLNPPLEVLKFLTENEKDLGGLSWSYWDKWKI